MNRYIAVLKCKSIEPSISRIPGYATYGFGLTLSGPTDVFVRNTIAHFVLNKEYTIVISEGNV